MIKFDRYLGENTDNLVQDIVPSKITIFRVGVHDVLILLTV
jgi:hypothetical protein